MVSCCLFCSWSLGGEDKKSGFSCHVMAQSSSTKHKDAGTSKDLSPDINSEWIKVVAESIGISTTAEDAFKYLADDVTFRHVYNMLRVYNVLHVYNVLRVYNLLCVYNLLSE